MGQGGSGGRYQSGLDRSGRTEIPYSVLRVRQTRGFSWHLGAFGGWGVVRHGSVGKTHPRLPPTRLALGVEPGRGSDVDPSGPGRKIGDSGLCLHFLCKTRAS